MPPVQYIMTGAPLSTPRRCSGSASSPAAAAAAAAASAAASPEKSVGVSQKLASTGRAAPCQRGSSHVRHIATITTTTALAIAITSWAKLPAA